MPRLMNNSKLEVKWLWPVALVMLAAVATGAIAASPDSDERVVAKLDAAFQLAVKHNDARTIAEILHPQMVLILGDGRVNTRAEQLQEPRAKVVDYEVHYEDPGTQTVRVQGDTAVVTASCPLRDRCSREPIGRRDELVQVAPLEGGMAGVRRDAQLGFGPRPVKIPRALHGTDDVVATLHYDCGDVPDAVDVVEELSVGAEESAVDEIVALDAREGIGDTILLQLRDVAGGRQQVAGCGLPDGPGLRRALAHRGVLARQPRVVGADHVTALCLRDLRDVVLP